MLLDLLDDAEDSGGRLAPLRAARHRRPQDPPLGVIDGDPLVAERNDGHQRLAGAAPRDEFDRAFAASRARIAPCRDKYGQTGNGKIRGPQPRLSALEIHITRRHLRPI